MRQTNWKTYLELLNTNYSKFYINRKFREKSFETDEKYLEIQTQIANDIETINKEIEEQIRKIIQEQYPNVEVLLYDSRVFSRSDEHIGKILTRGIPSVSETLDVKTVFEKISNVKISIDRFEDLPEEIQKNLNF